MSWLQEAKEKLYQTDEDAFVRNCYFISGEMGKNHERMIDWISRALPFLNELQDEYRRQCLFIDEELEQLIKEVAE